MRRPTFEQTASALLLGLLLLPVARMPFVDYRAYGRVFARQENRQPATFDPRPPALRGLRDNVVAEFEAWFTDRFAFRMELLALKARLYLLAGLSPREDLVLAGKDGWLFLGNSHHRVIEKTMGQLLFTEAELDAYVGDLEEKSRLLAARGVKFMVVIAPNKHTVYPEHLPSWVSNAGGRTVTSQLAERLRGGEVIFEDLTDDLLAAKAGTRSVLYYKADSHWNELGAYHGYRGLMRRISERMPGARALTELPFRPTADVKSGNARMIGAPPPSDEALEAVFGDGFNPLALEENCGPAVSPQPEGKAGRAKVKKKDNPRRRGPLVGSRRSTDQGYLAVLPNGCGSRQAAVVTGSGVAGGPRLLVLGDSFLLALSPYLNQSFAAAVYTYHPNAADLEEFRWYVDTYRPDLVLLEMAERGIEPPDTGRAARGISAIPRPVGSRQPAGAPPARPVARR